jgi:hypothetical protein
MTLTTRAKHGRHERGSPKRRRADSAALFEYRDLHIAELEKDLECAVAVFEGRNEVFYTLLIPLDCPCDGNIW